MAKKKKRAKAPKKLTIKKTRTTTRVTVRNPESVRVAKARLMGRIRRTATTAAIERLSGRIQSAGRYDDQIDRMASEAERKGWGDEAVEAEERGRQAGDRVFTTRRFAKATKKRNPTRNPKRPPKRWWDHCLAGVQAQKHARDPAAVCGATWWKMPAHQRAAIVHRWERGSPRQRRVAVAVAKAERNRALRGGKKKTRR